MAWPNNSIVELKYLYHVNGQVLMNVLHYAPEGVSTGFTVPELTQAFLDSNQGNGNGTFMGEAKKMMASEANFYQVTAQLVYPQRWQVKKATVNVSGAIAGAANAQNIAMTFEKLGDLGNRHNVGSLHLGGISDTRYVQGLFTNTALTDAAGLQTFLTATLVDAVSPATYKPVIMNKTPIPGSDPVRYQISGSSPITTVLIQDTIRTMRRRTLRLGI